MPMPCALRATVPPMRPRPMTPSRLPSSSKPVRPAFGHCAGLHAGIGARDVAREREQQRQRVFGGGERVAVGRVHHGDAFRRWRPRRRWCPRPRRRGRSRAGGAHFRARRRAPGVAERTSKASTSARAAARSSGFLMGSATATSQPASRNRARPSSWMPSQASTFIRTLRSGKERGQPCEPAGRSATSSGGARPVVPIALLRVGKRGRLAWESATTAAYHALPSTEQAP